MDRLLRTRDHPDRHHEIIEIMTEANFYSPFWVFLAPDEVERWSVMRIFNRMRLDLLTMGDRSEFWLGDDDQVEGHIVCAYGNDVSAMGSEPAERGVRIRPISPALPDMSMDPAGGRWTHPCGC